MMRSDASAAASTPAAPTGGSNSSSNNNNAAMNLFQKFSDMQRGIESSRQEREELQRELEKCQEEQESLKVSRREERKRRRQADEQANFFSEQVADLQREYEETIQPAYNEARLNKENAVMLQNRWKEHKSTVQQAFLEESREFQSTCKRLRMKASLLGLDNAAIRAAVYANSDGNPSEVSIYDGLDDDTIGVLGDVSTAKDPGTWETSDDDEEFQQLFEIYSEKKKEYESAQAELDLRNQRKQECVDKEASRAQRLEFLQRQLDRIAKDNSDLESQIQDLEQLTEEAKAMAATFSAGIEAHNQTKPDATSTVTPSPVARGGNSTAKRNNVPRNPYSQTKRSGKTATQLSAVNSQRRSELRAVVLGNSAREQASSFSPPSNQSYNYNQHPQSYRRRSRRDKQFGSSLEITGGHHNSSSDYATSSTKMEASPEEIQAPSQEGNDTYQPFGHSFDDDDDDDDDDALLSYVAFSN